MIIDYFFNCQIMTMNNENPIAKAMAISSGKIKAIGSEDEVLSFLNINSDMKILKHNLNGTFVLPSFIDTHLHPIPSIFMQSQLSLAGVKSYEALKQLIKKEDKLKEPSAWIFGIDLMEDNFDNISERQFPDKDILDSFGLNRPVAILRHDTHICSVNSLALNSLDLRNDNGILKEPTSGEIKVDEKGDPIGIFTEGATSFVLDSIPISKEGITEAAREFSSKLGSCGITTCGGVLQLGEIGFSGKSGTLEIPTMQHLIREGLIEQDYVFYIITDRPKKLKRLEKAFNKLDGGDNQFIVRGIKY